MPCLSPLDAWRSRELNANTKRFTISFAFREGHHDLSFTLPCGQCRWCRLEHSRQWAVRCTHEASLYERNAFITLTYSPEHLPANGSVDYDAPVLFMKRLRKKFGEGIRSYGCAEYGDKGGRPHYHICLFNHDFADKTPWKKIRGFQYYLSEDLQELWPFGHTVTADFSFETAAYVARYVTKKMTGHKAAEHYGDRLPEKPICVSRMPGIGRPWLDKFRTDVYPSDSVVMRGKEMKPPKYYDRRFEIEFPEEFCKLKKKRKKSLLEMDPNEGRGSRLIVKKEIQEYKFKQLKRGYESDS